MKSQMGGLRRKFMANQLITTTAEEMSGFTPEQEENIIEWITLFRRNWHIYAEMMYQIKLRPFQKVALWLMGVSDLFFLLCSRGLGY